MGSKKNNTLRAVTFMIVLAATAASLYFMFSIGRNQKSISVIAFFVGWIVAPFIGIFLLTERYQRFVSRPSFFYWLAMVASVASVVCYSGLVAPLGPKPAFIFLLAPFISWVLIAILFAFTRRSREKRSNKL